jgi:8-oxo-dGTP diphosphatase
MGLQNKKSLFLLSFTSHTILMANSVVVIVYKKNKVLLQCRDEHAPKYPSVWGLISGAIKKGELPEQALLREAQEELNYIIKEQNLFRMVEKINDGKKYYFETEYDGKELSLREGDGIVWWPIETAIELEMIPHHKEALEFWSNTGNGGDSA